MNRRELLQGAALASASVVPGRSVAAAVSERFTRVRPGDSGWPDSQDWANLRRRVGGRLLEVVSPIKQFPASETARRALLDDLRNPFLLGDEPGLTQTLGWVDAWTAKPSVYAVAAETSGDIAAAVDFARAHNLRLVVKGGGHSYQGTSNAPDSLLVWTRRMKRISLHDRFVAAGCGERSAPQAAVTIEAGALWGQVYEVVSVQAGRYVQGGGCLTVGVAGLVQSGGFGSLSKAYGTAAANLLEAELVTADGRTIVANRCTNPELFWALRGGGGGSFGVVTSLTLRTHELPSFIGAVLLRVEAKTDVAWRDLIERVIEFYRQALFNPHWGEQLIFERSKALGVSMVFQGLTQAEAQVVWQPFLDWLGARAADYVMTAPARLIAVSGRRFWDGEYLKTLPGIVLFDDRSGASASNMFWASNRDEAAQVLQGYQSAWLPATLLQPSQCAELVTALVEALRHWQVSLHCNKGLAGGSPEAIAATRETATNPAVLDAFGLLICGAKGPPAYPALPGHEPDVPLARQRAAAIDAAMKPIRRIAPKAGSYLAEGDYFDERWQQSFWGPNYGWLLAVKDRFDPDGLFIVHHGVARERWSSDGFSRMF